MELDRKPGYRIDAIRLDRMQIARLRRARKRARLGYRRMARLLGIGAHVNVFDIEHGERQMTVAEIEAWAAICGVSAESLWGGPLPDLSKLRRFVLPEERSSAPSPPARPTRLEHYALPRTDRKHMTDVMLELITLCNGMTVRDLEEVIATARLLGECRAESGGGPKPS